MKYKISKKPLHTWEGSREFCPWCGSAICQKEKKKWPKSEVTKIRGTTTWIHRKCYIASEGK